LATTACSIVTTDRLSAFDVVLPDPIPGKAKCSTKCQLLVQEVAHIVPNPLNGAAPETVIKGSRSPLRHGPGGRREKLKPLPVEAVVRGYLIGSDGKTTKDGAVCGIPLPKG